MALIKMKPTSPGTRTVIKVDRSHLYKGDPYAPLTGHQNKTGARNSFGRITNLPAVDAGGHAVVTGYYGTNVVARQEQNGITNSYELDAAGRQRARLQGGGGLEGTEVFHYDGSSDSVAWTERGTHWTRYVSGIGGELAAVQEGGGAVTFQLANLHGDVIATAEPSTPEPTYGSPARSSMPCTVPSSP